MVFRHGGCRHPGDAHGGGARHLAGGAAEEGGEEQDVEEGGEEQDVEEGGEEQDVEEGGEEQDVEEGGEEQDVEGEKFSFDPTFFLANFSLARGMYLSVL